ncbi:nucleoside deaminase [Thiolapillus sp.]
MKALCFSPPAWVDDYQAACPDCRDDKARMAFVIGAAARNVREGTGGPFAAAIYEIASGRLVSLGVNLVVPQGLSMLHAEMVAFSLAQRRLGTYDLGGPGLPAHELVTSTEPCAMCLGATCWSGVSRVVAAAGDADARAAGFDEGPKPDDWVAALEERGIQVRAGVLREKAVAVLREYRSRGGVIYNAGRHLSPP